jgi:hypothetical protein
MQNGATALHFPKFLLNLQVLFSATLSHACLVPIMETRDNQNIHSCKSDLCVDFLFSWKWQIQIMLLLGFVHGNAERHTSLVLPFPQEDRVETERIT